MNERPPGKLTARTDEGTTPPGKPSGTWVHNRFDPDQRKHPPRDEAGDARADAEAERGEQRPPRANPSRAPELEDSYAADQATDRGRPARPR